MRTPMIGLLLVSVLFAGCSGSGGSSSYLMTTGDLGSGFAYADIDDEDFAFFFAFLNMTSNPGAADPVIFEDEEGYNLTALHAAIIEYNNTGAGVFSAVLTFTSVSEADAYLAEESDCAAGDGFALFRQGAIVSLHDSEELSMEGQARFAAALDTYADRTGATYLCT